MNVEKVFKPNVVYNKLKEMIIHLELTPGELVSETEASQIFNVSRTSIRSAFKKLETEGLLVIEPQRGTYVSLISMEAIDDILFLRENIEGACIKTLISKDVGFPFYKLNAVLNKQLELIEDEKISIDEKARLFFQYDNEFHGLIFSLAGRSRIWETLSKIDYQYSRFRVFLNVADNKSFRELYEEHVKIYEIIINKEDFENSNTLHNHLYNGIRISAAKINERPEYFLDF